MKVLFLTPYPFNTAPSQRFRFEQFYPFLTENNIQFNSQSFIDEKTWKILYTEGKVFQKFFGIAKGFINRFFILFSVSKYDFVFIHREASPIGPPIFEWIIVNVFRKKVIYDFDDAIWLPNTSDENKLVKYIKWHGKVKSVCKWAYKVSCGNEFLKNYSIQHNENTIYFPTIVNTTDKYIPINKPNNDKIVIGWTGSQSTIKYLDAILDVIEKLENEFTNVEFLVISNKKPDFGHLKSFSFIQWSADSEIEDLSLIDIGLMPLENTIWEKGKCAFKAIQYLALEIPAVVSPVGANTSVVFNNENGLYFEDNEQLYSKIKYLINNPQERNRMGVKGRKHIEENFSVHSQNVKFKSLFGDN